MPRRQYTTEEGFNIRLEARLKNAELIGAREMAGLTAKEAAERIGISYAMYLGYESMRMYPSEKAQKNICGFYRNLGIFLLEEDIFPKELKALRPERKYIGEKTIPKVELLSLSTDKFDRKLLPVVEGEVEKKVEYDELRTAIHEILSQLPHRQRKVIRMRYGFDGEEQKTCEETGEIFGVTKSRIQQIEAKALGKLRHPSYGRKLKSFLEGY